MDRRLASKTCPRLWTLGSKTTTSNGPATQSGDDDRIRTGRNEQLTDTEEFDAKALRAQIRRELSSERRS